MDNVPLARAEIEAVFPEIVVEQCVEGVLVFRSTARESEIASLAKRLSYTNVIAKAVVVSLTYKFIEEVKKVNWKQYYKDSFFLTLDKRHKTANVTTPDLARVIATQIPDVVADSYKPGMPVYAYVGEKISVAGIVLHVVEKEFNGRKPHMRPEHHPSSLQPKLARALVNLTGLHKGQLMDPFCGTGGILIEAGLLGLYCKGIDNRADMIEKARINIEHYHITRYSLQVGDATTTTEKADVIVTDVPYGKNTRDIDDNLYERFLTNAARIAPLMVVCFPSTHNVDSLLFKAKSWQVLGKYEYYIHAGLSKVICVLKRKDVNVGAI